MASKYLKLFPVPQGFNEILHDFASAVLKYQPKENLEYGAEYFENISEVPIN